jgi:hypothetical protein
VSQLGAVHDGFCSLSGLPNHDGGGSDLNKARSGTCLQ